MRSKSRESSASYNVQGESAHGTIAKKATARNMLSTWQPTHLTEHVLEAAIQR